MSEIICEECDTPMHLYAFDGVEGYACPGCGWSYDTTEPVQTQPIMPATTLAIKEILRRFHRNSCYPEALDNELDVAVNDIIKLMNENN